MSELLRRFGFTVYAPDDGSGSGSDGGGGDGTGGDGGDGGDGDGDDKTPKFTQAAANRFEKTGKAKGKAAALREVAETLGMTVEEAKEFIDTQRAEQDGKLSDLDKRERDVDAREKKAEATERKAAETLRDARAMAALAGRGITFETDDDGNLKGKGARVLKLVTADLDSDADGATISAAIDELKADTPELFTGSSSNEGDGHDGSDNGSNGDGGDGGRRPPSGETRGPKPKHTPTEDDLTRGAARAKEYVDRDKPFDPLATS